jgi:putative FmdB family regulatory protein
MPIMEFECPNCGHIIEQVVFASEIENGYMPSCKNCNIQMNRIISMPAQHRVGGVEGKLREGELIKKRNDAYHNSKKGQEEHKHNVQTAHKKHLGI